MAAPAPKRGAKGRYKKASAKATAPEPVVQTDVLLDLEGIAPSDIEVATYIANLSTSILLEDVQLVESREQEIDKIKYREFHLKARLVPDIKLSKEDIEQIRNKRNETI